MTLALPYELQGSGPRHVICLHGWFADRSAFRAIRPYLDGESFTYVFPDIRGYGEAMRITGDFTLDEVARDVLALADHLGWSHFSLIGHSMGGKAAQRVLALAPDRVNALVGVSPVPASGLPFDEQGWALFAGAPDEPSNRRAILDITTGRRLTKTWLDAAVRYSIEHSDIEAYRKYLTDFATVDFHDEIVGKRVPALAIVGEYDPAISADSTRATWLAWYPNATLEVLANAGHYAPDETPIALVTTMERFLST